MNFKFLIKAIDVAANVVLVAMASKSIYDKFASKEEQAEDEPNEEDDAYEDENQ